MRKWAANMSGKARREHSSNLKRGATLPRSVLRIIVMPSEVASRAVALAKVGGISRFSWEHTNELTFSKRRTRNVQRPTPKVFAIKKAQRDCRRRGSNPHD